MSTPFASTLLAATAVASSLLAAGAATASANVVATGEVEAPAPRRVEARVGVLLGGSDVGDADGFSAGVTTGIGYRVGDVTLRGRFDHYRVGDGANEAMSRRGRGSRLGGAVRYSFATTFEERHDRIGIDFWGEAGIGVEHIAWRRGGVLDRPSAELALGFELDGRGRRDAANRQRHIGYFMAFRSFVGQGPEIEGVPMCGGPCDRATKPSRMDVSMFFELGLHWGR